MPAGEADGIPGAARSAPSYIAAISAAYSASSRAPSPESTGACANTTSVMSAREQRIQRDGHEQQREVQVRPVEQPHRLDVGQLVAGPGAVVHEVGLDQEG